MRIFPGRSGILAKCLSNFLLNVSIESFSEFEETSSSLKDIGRVLNKRGAMLKKLVSLILRTLVFILVLLEILYYIEGFILVFI